MLEILDEAGMKFDKLKPGMVVFSVGKMRMGNTAIKTVVVHHVTIKSIDMQSRRVVASWNGNGDREYRERDVSNWREKKPILVSTVTGAKRLANREEIKFMKDNKQYGWKPL